MRRVKTFRDLIARNKRRSSVLLVLLFIVVVGVCITIALPFYDRDSSDWPERQVTWGITAGLLASLAVLGWTYFRGSGAVMLSIGGHEVSSGSDQMLFNVVDEMRIAAGLPMPSVYIIDDDSLNALAAGWYPKHAAVAVTSGLRERLTRDELQAVVAHEISHIRNHDIRLATLTAVIVGTLTTTGRGMLMLALAILLSDGPKTRRRTRSYSTSSGKRGKKQDDGAVIIGALLLLLLFVGAVLRFVGAPPALLLQLAISREREYLADAGAVELTRHPEALISALQKLEYSGQESEVLASGKFASLCIVNPLKHFAFFRHWAILSTHPPLEKRIARIRGLLCVPPDGRELSEKDSPQMSIVDSETPAAPPLRARDPSTGRFLPASRANAV